MREEVRQAGSAADKDDGSTSESDEKWKWLDVVGIDTGLTLVTGLSAVCIIEGKMSYVWCAKSSLILNFGK